MKGTSAMAPATMPPSMLGWIRQLFGQRSPRRTRSRSGPSHPRARRVVPLLEALEDRLVPTNFVVTSLADSGTGTLHAAINQANASSDSTSAITFAPDLSGTINLSALTD